MTVTDLRGPYPIGNGRGNLQISRARQEHGSDVHPTPTGDQEALQRVSVPGTEKLRGDLAPDDKAQLMGEVKALRQRLLQLEEQMLKQPGSAQVKLSEMGEQQGEHDAHDQHDEHNENTLPAVQEDDNPFDTTKPVLNHIGVHKNKFRSYVSNLPDVGSAAIEAVTLQDASWAVGSLGVCANPDLRLLSRWKSGEAPLPDFIAINSQILIDSMCDFLVPPGVCPPRAPVMLTRPFKQLLYWGEVIRIRHEELDLKRDRSQMNYNIPDAESESVPGSSSAKGAKGSSIIQEQPSSLAPPSGVAPADDNEWSSAGREEREYKLFGS
ncbi:hypothetical protein F5Y17DRAFT_463619 [Xylariaceae sp. FL0594]|nr:hypothetical protein F5Y17DRAFT_463619 [Xylariaceae sp. FL0594]